MTRPTYGETGRRAYVVPPATTSNATSSPPATMISRTAASRPGQYPAEDRVPGQAGQHRRDPVLDRREESGT